MEGGMSLTVHKQNLSLVDDQEISAPEDAEFLHVAEQHGRPTLWYRCDIDKPDRLYQIAVCGTGHECPSADEAVYVGTFLMHGGALVWHVFVKPT
jgi:hypothetical protein